VISSDDGSSISGARVTLDSFSCREPAPEVLTRLDGSFELDGIPLQQALQWRVHADGYRSLERQLELRASESDVEFELLRGVPLEFLVVDAQTGAPIPHAVVARGSAEAMADATGRATSSSLLAVGEAEVSLRASASRYCALHAKLDSTHLESDEPIKLPLLAAASLWGYVLDADAQPIAKVTLSLMREFGSRKPAPEGAVKARDLVELPEGWYLEAAEYLDTVSDASGKFSFDGLEPHSNLYHVTPVRDRRRLAAAESEIILGPPGSSSQHDIVLVKQAVGVVTGMLTLNGKPLSAELIWHGPTRNDAERVDATGRFRIEVEPGLVSFTPRIDLLPVGNACNELFAGPWTVQVPPDGEASIDIALEIELAPIAGRVVDVSGAPRIGVWVAALSQEGCWQQRVRTDGDGRFEMMVRAGPWSYLVGAGRYPDSTKQDGVMAGTCDLELMIGGSGALRLRVVDSTTGSPLTGFSLEIENERGIRLAFSDRFNANFKPDQESWYELGLHPGNWKLFVCDPRMAAISGYLPVDGGSIEVQAGSPQPVIELQRQRGLELRVQLAEGEDPLPSDVSVLLLESDRTIDLLFADEKWQIGPSFRGLRVLETRRIQPTEKDAALAQLLRQGAYRFAAFPNTIAVQPEEVMLTGAETAPLEIRWKPR
jgi:hypothetical protein